MTVTQRVVEWRMFYLPSARSKRRGAKPIAFNRDSFNTLLRELGHGATFSSTAELGVAIGDSTVRFPFAQKTRHGTMELNTTKHSEVRVVVKSFTSIDKKDMESFQLAMQKAIPELKTEEWCLGKTWFAR